MIIYWTLHRSRQHTPCTKRSSRTENPYLASQSRTSKHKDYLYLCGWKEAYVGKLKLFRTSAVSEASKIEMRMPFCIEIHAYVFGDSPYPKHPWPFDYGAPIIPLFAGWPGSQHPMVAGWMEKMRPI